VTINLKRNFSVQKEKLWY